MLKKISNDHGATGGFKAVELARAYSHFQECPVAVDLNHTGGTAYQGRYTQASGVREGIEHCLAPSIL